VERATGIEPAFSAWEAKGHPRPRCAKVLFRQEKSWLNFAVVEPGRQMGAIALLIGFRVPSN